VDGFLLGIILAMLSGIATNGGQLLEKKTINALDPGAKLTSVVKKPLWILGEVFENGISIVLFLIAQLYIGPSLIPGLMAVGLIVLAIGSVKLLNEKLNRQEYMGILLLVVGIIALGFSGLQINIVTLQVTDFIFLFQTTLFTVILFVAMIVCYSLQKTRPEVRGILLGLSSGFMYSLSNLWIAPLLAIIDHVLGGGSSIGEILFFVVACVILILTNLLSIIFLQKSYQGGQISRIIPIQQVPIQIVPILIFFLVFSLPIPSVLTIPFAITAVALILYSSALLSKRQASLEKISQKLEEKSPDAAPSEREEMADI